QAPSGSCDVSLVTLAVIVCAAVLKGFGNGLGNELPFSSVYATITLVCPLSNVDSILVVSKAYIPSPSSSHCSEILTGLATGTISTCNVICCPKPKQSLSKVLSTRIKISCVTGEPIFL